MRSIGAAALLLCLACSPAARAEKPETPDEQALYELGLRFAKRLEALEVTERELAILQAGILDAYAGKAEADEASTANLLRFQRERMLRIERAQSKVFLDAAAAEQGARSFPSGLVYLELEAGSGEQPGPTDMVRVAYRGTLRTGQVFDQSDSIAFPLGSVIACWQEGIPLLKVGGKARLFCPAEIAYGDTGSPPQIAPGAALQFDVELLGIGDAE